MKRQLYIPKEMAEGYTRREFIKYLELAGIGVTIGATGLISGCRKKDNPLAGAKEVITRCGLCGPDCGMKAYIKDGRLLAVAPWDEDPHSKGFMCDMGLASVEHVYSPDRVLNPKRRIGDKWADITWDEALNIIADKLTALHKDPGPQSVVCHYGVSQVRASFYRMLFKRFSNVYGTPNFTGCGSQCANATGMAKKYSIGSASPDYENTKCIIQWGNNPSSSGILDWLNEILPAKERGAKLICIDPRSNAMTEMADIHLRPRPGSDGALALSMMNVIISRGLCNASFIEKNTIGFDELKKLAGQYKPEHAETITGIPAQDIIRVSEAFAKNSPACIETGNALELHINGVQTIRAALLLQALTGNIGVKGGSISGGERRTSLADMEMKDHKPFTAKSFSADTHPLLWEERKMTNANLFPEAVLSEKPYPIKALLVIGANPVVTGPNASRQRQAYKKLDLMVVYDFFMTETAKCANLFLPAATYLERDNIKVRNRAMMTPKVIAEQGNSRPEWKLWFDLAKRMGYNNEFPWNTVDECINEYLAPINVTAADLRSNFNGAPLTKKSGDKKDEAQKFETHSGKIEFSSPTLAKAGINPLPAYVDPHEGRANKELRSHYPLLMTSGAKTPYYFHSQFHNLPSLNAKFPAPVVEMSLEDANALGISQDAMVSISSPRGKISAKANIVKGLKKGIVAMCHGWDKANVNELTDNSSLDPISGFPGLKGFFCKVEKA